MNKSINHLWIFLVVVLFEPIAGNDEECFENSIFRALKKQNAQFRSEIEVRRGWLVYGLKENFSFKLNIGELVRNFSSHSTFRQIKQLYLSNEKELHQFSLDAKEKFCISYHWYNFAGIVWKLLAYAPRPALNENSTYNIIGELFERASFIKQFQF